MRPPSELRLVTVSDSVLGLTSDLHGGTRNHRGSKAIRRLERRQRSGRLRAEVVPSVFTVSGASLYYT